ncbi:ABC transporter substrate-binding protein/permease [Haploplasma modicum]|uniref:ABC transporter substrate-binding protein/permease n=1 Tax=Haploplasma modicum TaxID=2150 RepID=UPI000559780B|nr:ABC transporter substrate-binding protein/permease [Haploplasma modicum]
MKKQIMILVLIISSVFLLVGCSSKNIYTYILDDSYKEYLVMGTSADYPPYESPKKVNGKMELVGIDIELAKEIAKAAGKNLKIVNKDFDFLLDDLVNNKVDFVISGMNPSPERELIVDFSDVYYEATHSVIINNKSKDKFNSVEDLNNNKIKVGAQLGSIQQEIVEADMNQSNTVFLKNVTDLIMQLKDDKLDAVILETPVASSFIKNNKDLSLLNFTVGTGEDGTAVAVSEGNVELLNLINYVINNLIDTGKMEQIINDAILGDEIVEKSFPFSFIFNIDYVKILLQGLLMTIVLALLSVTLGSLIGLFVALGRIVDNKFINTISKGYVEIIRGTPLLVQVLLIYSLFKLPVILVLGIDLSSFIPGVIALLINSSAYVSEIIRGGINSIDTGQKEAALSLGFNDKQVMRKIILPQAVKNIIPSLGNEFVTMIKETSIFMYLGVAELMYAASIVKVQTYQIKEVYIVTALLYLVLTLSTSKLMTMYERKLGLKDEK